MTDTTEESSEVNSFKFILQNNEEVEITISKMGHYFGMKVSKMPDNFAIYNSGHCFGSIGALIFSETLAQRHSDYKNNAKKVVISYKQLSLIQEYLNQLPDEYTGYHFRYDYVKNDYISIPYKKIQDKEFPPENIELALK